MKTIKLFLSGLLLCTALSVFAQNNHFNYQAVLRDSDGNMMANEAATVVFSIKEGSAGGTTVYTESHSTTTNDQGLINLEIGGGTASSGDFSTIAWQGNSHFLNVKINGTDMGTSEFKYVPYANYADKAGNVFSGDYNDLSNQPTLFSGDYNDLSNQPTLFSGDYNDLTNTPTELWQQNSNDISYLNGNVGIGTTTPTQKLEVNGAIKINQTTSHPDAGTLYANSNVVSYGYIASGGSLTGGNYGVASYNNTSIGVHTITLDNNTYNYPVVVATAYGAPVIITYDFDNVLNTINIKSYNLSGNLTDIGLSFIVFGN